MSSNPTSDSFVNMDVEAGPSEPQPTPVPAGAKLAFIEVASILIIGVTSYTIYLDLQKCVEDDQNDDCDPNNWQKWIETYDHDAPALNYSLAVGVVSLVVCLVARAMAKASPDSPVVTRILPGLLTLWWFFGTGYMTFVGPYNAACVG